MTRLGRKGLIYYGNVCTNINDKSPNIVSRIYTYPRGLYRGYTAYIVLRLPCCCSGHNIIPTTHRRNEPFIAALLGCCFLSQANTTTTTTTTSSLLPPPLTAAPAPNVLASFPFESLFLFLAAHHVHTHNHYPRCDTLRICCVYAPVHASRCVAPRRAALHLRSELHLLRVACHENFVGIPLAAANYRRDVPQGRL